jgi:hypothetical protein
MMKKLWLMIPVVLASCAAKKQAAELELQPEWMKQKPIVHGYYIGIGSAKKVGTSASYIAEARKDALADLAGEVSATISSTSVLHTIETEYGHSETFDQTIRTSVDDYLEGFEPAEAFETADSYWVYFRIAIETYHAMKARKKNEAIDAAMAKYISGISEKEGSHPAEALTFFLQGLQMLKPYLDEETSAEYKGNKIDLGNNLYGEVSSIISDLAIESGVPEITVKRGTTITPALRFKVLYSSKPVQGVPVEFSYTGGYLKTDRGNSGPAGIIELNSEAIYSRNAAEQIQASVNLRDIALKAVDDLFIRGLMAKKSIPPAIIIIRIIQPALALKIDPISCSSDDCDKIVRIFEEAALSSGYQIVSEKSADYIFGLKFGFKPGQSSGGLTSVYLNFELTVTDRNANPVWSKKPEEIKGVSTDGNGARIKAFDEFLSSLQRKYFQQGIDEIE